MFNAYQSIIEDQKADANKLLAQTEEIYESKIKALRNEFELKLKSIQDELETYLNGKTSVISACTPTFARQ